jgi:signal transduction histidine kinase
MPVKLHAVEASAPARKDYPLDAAVDGVLSGSNGWSLKEGQYQHQFAVFATDKPIPGTIYQLHFFFLQPDAASYLLRFGISVTTDEKPSLQGHWMPLLPANASSNFTNKVEVSGAIIHVKSNRPGMIVTLRARAPFTGITGFRLRMRPAARDSDAALPAAVGNGPDGNFLLTEFEVEAEPLYTSNIALDRQVYSSGMVPRDLPVENLTDGLTTTFSRLSPSPGGQDSYFYLDLGRVVTFDHLVIRSRSDALGAAPLVDYSVDLLADTDQAIRKSQWHTLVHHPWRGASPDGSDVIRAKDGEGTFTASGIRIHNRSDRSFDIAEIEVYPALNPEAQDWVADGVSLAGGKEIAVPFSSHKLAFTIKSRELGILPMALVYRWRVTKFSGDWRDVDSNGRAELVPPPPGSYQLEIQAQHTDGIWDQSNRIIAFEIAAPWWRNPRILAIVTGSLAILVAAVWWRVAVWRMNRRLAVAEQHLELHRERLRIARDMHDEIGARLTFMALLADRTEREAGLSDDKGRGSLHTLAENARSAVHALDNIVWAVNPEHDTVGSLADYLCDYAPSYLDAADIQCRLDIHVENPERRWGLTVRHGLLMAIKEALQNVVKHADAKNVRLGFHDGREQIEVSISDDGQGISGRPGGIDQSGLDNMQQRLAEIGGCCEIRTPSSGAGTEIRFIVPLNRLAPAESARN